MNACIVCHTPLPTKHLRCRPCQRELCRLKGIAIRRAAGVPTLEEWNQIQRERAAARFPTEAHRREYEAARSAKKRAKLKERTGRTYYPKKNRKPQKMNYKRKRGAAIKIKPSDPVPIVVSVAPVDITGHTVTRVASPHEREDEERREEWRRWLEGRRGE